MGLCSCQSNKKTKELIYMGDEKGTPENQEDGKRQEDKNVGDAAQQAVKNVKEKTKDLQENAMLLMSSVKSRVIARRKQLIEANKHKHQKQMIMGKVVWKDFPPRLLIGEISVSISGGTGKVRYVRYLKNPDNGYAIKEASADGIEIGGNLISHYVEEIIEVAQKIKIREHEVEGCPNVETAMKNMNAARDNERKRIASYRGIK